MTNDDENYDEDEQDDDDDDDDGLWYLLRMPPSSDALRHSGGERRLFTSAIVTLYLDVELSKDSLPGTEQNRSVGFTTHVPPVAKQYNIHILLTPMMQPHFLTPS